MREAGKKGLSSPDFDMLVDVVDGQNRPVGTARRRDVLPAKQNFRTVHALLYAPDEAALILQFLPADHPRSPLRFGSSVAGYLRAGEDYSTAVRRKLADELFVTANMTLSDLGEVVMDDEGARKFIGVYTGTLPGVRSFAHDQIAGLAMLPVPTIDSLVAGSPELFTRTFLHVYKRFRSGRRGRR